MIAALLSDERYFDASHFALDENADAIAEVDYRDVLPMGATRDGACGTFARAGAFPSPKECAVLLLMEVFHIVNADSCRVTAIRK